MTNKSKSDSIRKKLSNLANKLKVPYRSLETAFLIERLAVRLVADKKLSEHLVFKGGFVGLRVHGSPRYTIDLDAVILRAEVEFILKRARKSAETDIGDGVWFRFEGEAQLTTQGDYGGIRQVYRAGIGQVLPEIKRAQLVHFDLGIGDPITPGPMKVETPLYLTNNEDLSWSVYPVETICAEKLHALIKHGDANSRSKDVFDLSVFLPNADGKTLGLALARCFQFRKSDLPDKISITLKNIDTHRLEQGWPNSVSTVAQSPDFKTAFEAVLTHIIHLEKAF